MGVKSGHLFVDVIKFGRYNKQARKFVIYVDGENIRYRGMISSNLSTHNAEEAIAVTSFEYLKNAVRKIELLLGRICEDVIVYMDGKRVANKTANRAVFKYDAAMIREIFKGICGEHGYTVIDLRHGESELQMYLQRNREMDVNVFLTNDTDMIPICYDHIPFISWTDDEYQRGMGDNESGILDFNSSYKVVDSCLWVNCGTKGIVAIGLDNVRQKLRFNLTVFRVFIALCGTDFTESMFTESMITTILGMSDQDVAYVNSLTDDPVTEIVIHQIVSALLLHSLRFGARIKPLGKKLNDLNASFENVAKAVSMYMDYVSSGSMVNDEIPRPNMSTMMRKYIYVMKGQTDLGNLEKKRLTAWANVATFAEIRHEVTKHFIRTGLKRNISESNQSQEKMKFVKP